MCTALLFGFVQRQCNEPLAIWPLKYDNNYDKITATKEYCPLEFKIALFTGQFYFIISKIVHCFFFFQNWEEIKIEEETEEGKKVESIIRVPAQVFSP